MSEKNFQKALIHLYTNIDRHDSYSDAMFEQFALSCPERQWLEELMTSQRDGLLLFNQQLYDKRCRLIRDALPKSREVARRQLETLLDAYASCPAPEGARHPAGTVRAFADYAGARIHGQTDVSKELEFIRFEAVYASLSLRSASTDFDEPPPRRADVRLSLEGDAALVPCTYDVVAAMEDPSVLRITDRQPGRRWLFLFRSRRGGVRILSIAPGLARVLAMFGGGLSLGEIVQALESQPEKAAASGSVKKLLLLGAPFVSKGARADRGREAAG